MRMARRSSLDSDDVYDAHFKITWISEPNMCFKPTFEGENWNLITTQVASQSLRATRLFTLEICAIFAGKFLLCKNRPRSSRRQRAAKHRRRYEWPRRKYGTFQGRR